MSSGKKEVDEDWESAEKITQQKLNLVSNDVVDDWEQQLDEPKPVPAPEPSKDKPAKKETKTSKSKGTEKSEPSVEPVLDLTKEEQQRAIIESDKQLIRELIGPTPVAVANTIRIDTFEPKNASDFKTLATAIIDRCGQFKSSDQFSAFSEQIVRGLCNLADLKDARRFNQILTTDNDSRNKAEKAKSKAKKGGKLQLGNAVKIGGKGGKGVDMRAVTDEYEDFYGPSGSAAAQRSDVDEDDEPKPAAAAAGAAAAAAAPAAPSAEVASSEPPKKERLPANFDEEGFI